MEAIMKLFEPYDRKARLYPALLTLVPLFVLLLCRYGKQATWGSGIVSLLVFCGGLFWIARVARNAGVRVQTRMWRPWNGRTPTVRYLQHWETTCIDSETKARYHSVLAAGVGKPFPSAADEEADPAAADELYWSGIKWLMEQTRDTKKYGHLFKENIAYGFQRNMRGIKPVAIAIAAVCLLAGLFWVGVLSATPPYVHLDGSTTWTFEQVMAVLVPIGALALWVFSVDDQSVQQASDAYSERLLQACEGFAKGTKAKTPRAKKEKDAA